MPAPGKPFDLFVAEETICRQYAAQQAGLAPPQAAEQSVLTGAVAGTALGAAAGATLGAAAGNAGIGAAAGAGTGLLVGTAVGTDAGYGATWMLQRRYDIAYVQCMYAKGNQVPGLPVVSMPPPPPRMVENLDCLYPIAVAQVGCILDRTISSRPPT
jgi:hypothetical protein